MAERIETLDQLQNYLRGVNERAIHHAKDVSESILALAGAVILFRDPGSELKIRTTEGKPGNMLWMTISNRRYALAYNHEDQSVEVRDRTQTGDVLFSVDDSTPVRKIVSFFEGLTAATV